MAESESPSPLVGDATDVAQAPDLCTQCGLCCMGAIHRSAVLEEDEVDAARVIGLDILGTPGRPLFALPCPKLQGASCTIFGQRPRVCPRYKCQVLHDYTEGTINFGEAEARVGFARRLFEDLRSVLPKGMTVGEARSLAHPSSVPPNSEPDLSPKARLGSIALQVYLDKYFRLDKELRAIDMKGIDEE